jgi:hypothetical protein
MLLSQDASTASLVGLLVLGAPMLTWQLVLWTIPIARRPQIVFPNSLRTAMASYIYWVAVGCVVVGPHHILLAVGIFVAACLQVACEPQEPRRRVLLTYGPGGVVLAAAVVIGAEWSPAVSIIARAFAVVGTLLLIRIGVQDLIDQSPPPDQRTSSSSGEALDALLEAT